MQLQVDVIMGIARPEPVIVVYTYSNIYSVRKNYCTFHTRRIKKDARRESRIPSSEKMRKEKPVIPNKQNNINRILLRDLTSKLL